MFPGLLIGAALADPGGSATPAGATVQTRARLAIRDCALVECPFIDFQDAAVFSPWVEAPRDSRVAARGAVSLRLHGPTGATGVPSDNADTQPWSLRIDDAWVSARGDHLDAQLGAWRAAWGQGAGISVVDPVNPMDLTDPTRFDQRRAVPLIGLTAHSGALSLQGVVAPWFVPASLPADRVDLLAGADDLFNAESTGAADISLNEVEARATPGTDQLRDMNAGARLRWTGGRADVAMSWFHGRDSLPQVDGEVLLTGFQTDTNRVDVAVPMRWPRVDQGGLEARGELFADITGWAELAVVLPERTSATTSLRQLEALERIGTISEVPNPLPETVTQNGQPYARWLIGADRQLGPVRVNVQWLRGFPTERQAADLRDYGLALIRWAPLPHLAFDLSGAADVRGDGGMGTLRASWLYADAIELQAWGTLAGGPDGSTFGGYSAVSHVGTGAELRF